MRRRFRLRRSTEIETLWREGKRWHHPLVLLIGMKSNHPSSRFGFSAGKYVGSAVNRNKAKRLLREAVHQHLVEIENGWDFLFVARKGMDQAKFIEVKSAVHSLLNEAGVLNNDSP